MNNKKPRVKTVIIISIIFFSLFLITLYFNKIVNPLIYSFSEAKVRSLSTKAVNNAVSEVVSNNNIYDSLIHISTDVEGKISLIQANSIQINNLTKELIKISQLKIEKMGMDGVLIPLGTFTGIPIFNGIGPSIKVKLIPIGSTTCSFSSKFTNAGINQTNHKIYVVVETNVNVLTPLKNAKVKTQTEILLCESIIIGNIPQVYLSSPNLQDMTDLIPDVNTLWFTF